MKTLYSYFSKCLISALLLVIILQSKSFAQASDGGYAESWLSRNIGARPIAMAGVYSAIVNEPVGIFYNPAGAAFMADVPSVNSSVSTLGLGRTFASISWAQEILPSLGVGLGINNLYSGSFTGRNLMGDPTSSLNNNQIAAQLVAAYRLEFISMGAGVKYIHNSLNGANISAKGIAFDLGMKLNVLDLFSFGIAMNNIGGSMNWNTASQISESIPFTIRTGVAAEFGLNEESKVARTSITGEEETIIIPPSRYILIGMDAVMNQYDSTPSFVLGVEAVFHEFFAVRGGIALYGDSEGEPQILPMNIWGAGISLRPEISSEFNLHIDYAISSEYLTNNRIAHHISLIFEL